MGWLWFLPVLLWTGSSLAAESASDIDALAEGKRRFETHCIGCHGLELPLSQQLDRPTWRWVMNDMVTRFGAKWLTDEDQSLIIDYLLNRDLPPGLEEGKKRFETHCGTCHSLSLPRSQRLDRAAWEWVMDDMVNEFGAKWLTADDQRLILDYLTGLYGPEG